MDEQLPFINVPPRHPIYRWFGQPPTYAYPQM